MKQLGMTAICTSAVLMAAVAQGAWAADNVAPAKDKPAADSTQVQEIVVTATRQAQKINKVAESITAFNQKTMDIRGIDNIVDITRMTPGLQYNANGFGTQTDIAIRGIDSQVGSATTGIYIDDTPIQTRVVGYSATNTYPLVFDLERVEVLRGPQGTLFGAGSEGGTIRFITPQPSLTDYKAYVKSDVAGTLDGSPSYQIGGAVGGPIIKDKIGFRVAYWAQHEGGYVDRQNLNPEIENAAVHQDSNWTDTQVANLALAFSPTPGMTITPSVYWQDQWLNDIGTYWEDQSNPGKGKYVNGQPLRQPDHNQFILPALRFQYDFSGMTLISNTSFYQRKDDLIDDYSTLVPAIFAGVNFIPGSPDYAAYANMVNKQTVYTEELRLQNANPTARFNWVSGLFLSQSEQKAYETIVDPKMGDVTEYAYGLTVEEALGMPLIDDKYSLKAAGQGLDKQAALFGQGDFNITSQLKLTAGLRVTWASFTGSSFGTGPFVGDTIVQPAQTINETPVTPKFGITYQLDPGNLFYASASKGYRIGGTNAPLSDFCAIGDQGYLKVPTEYGSDSLWSYEIGAKNLIDHGRIQVNTSAFHINWSNIQQLVYVSNCGQQFVDNLGSATSNGFDIQFSAHPIAGLEIDGTVGYTVATFSQNVNKNNAPFNVVSAGDNLDTQPWDVTVGATYDKEFAGGYDAYIRGDFEYHSGSGILPVTNPANGGFDPGAEAVPPTTYASMRGGVRWHGYDLSVYVDNLFNSHPEITRYSEVIGNPVHRDFTFRPLTVGLTGIYRY